MRAENRGSWSPEVYRSMCSTCHVLWEICFMRCDLREKGFSISVAGSITDYHVQGQTTPCVVVDIVPQPIPGLLLFNPLQLRTRDDQVLRDFKFQAPAVECTCGCGFSPTASCCVVRPFTCNYPHGIPDDLYVIIDIGCRGEVFNRFLLSTEPPHSTWKLAWRCWYRNIRGTGLNNHTEVAVNRLWGGGGGSGETLGVR